METALFSDLEQSYYHSKIWIPKGITPDFDDFSPPPLKRSAEVLSRDTRAQFFTRNDDAVSTNYCIAVAYANFCALAM